MFGKEKPISECATWEIRSFLKLGTIVASIICAATFWTSQPLWFCWLTRFFCFIWLVTLWSRALRELRLRSHHIPSRVKPNERNT